MPQRTVSLENLFKAIIITVLFLEKRYYTGMIKASQSVSWISIVCLTFCVIKILRRFEAVTALIAETVEYFQIVSFEDCLALCGNRKKAPERP